MKKLKYLLKKEFLQVFRNKFLLRLILFMPVMQLAILPWAATFDQRDILLSIVDNDKSSISTKMTDKILSSGFFKLTDYSPTYEQALSSIEQGKSDLILEIPRDFEKNIINNSEGGLMLSLDAVNGQKAGLGLSYISQIINSYISDMAVGTNQPTVEIKPYYRYNTKMRYQDYMVPGILVVLVSMMGGMLSSLNIVREKEIGTMEQINVTPVSKLTFILGKLIPFWIIGLVILSLGMFIAWLIYGLFPIGHIINIYIFAFFYLLAFTGLGLMISNFARTQQQAMFMILFFLIIFILISGLFTPITSMPEWAQKVTYINPLRYFVEVMRLIYMKGSGLTDILPDLLKIIGFAVALNILAIASYRKTNG
ncbi:MAG: ABC transporter permease [Prevotella sp.]|nr:ABC transporter permease [Prevotella sp.]